jgi:release factor glutamine methyltransferase
MRLKSALENATRSLARVSDAPYLDAQWLLLHVLGREETSWLLAHSSDELSLSEAHTFQNLVAQRASGKPLAYILGFWEFYGRRFSVTDDVLVPRPSTEALVEAALETLRNLAGKQGRPLVVADIGTGSGCIAITLVLESLYVKYVYATDISGDALRIAQHNARQHEVADHIVFLQGDMLAPLAGKHVDLVVSNPPYVASSELDQARGNARGILFEPRVALDGGLHGDRLVHKVLAGGWPTIAEGTSGLIYTNTME